MRLDTPDQPFVQVYFNVGDRWDAIDGGPRKDGVRLDVGVTGALVTDKGKPATVAMVAAPSSTLESTSGRTYRTPIMAFRSADGRRMTFALTYGSSTDWLKNVLAAGEAGFDSRWSGELRLIEPRFVHDPERRAVPWPIRQILRLMRVDEFLETTIVA